MDARAGNLVARVEAINKLAAFISDELKQMLDVKTRTCINCMRFNEPLELCNKFKQRPPARIIALGCERYMDEDDIPF